MSDCKYCYNGICCNDSCDDVFGDYPSKERCLECERREKDDNDDERRVSD